MSEPMDLQEFLDIEDEEIESALFCDRPLLEYSKRDLAAALVWMGQQERRLIGVGESR